MKFARFRSLEGEVHAGVLGEDVLHTLAGVDDLAALLDAGGRTLAEAGRSALEHADNVWSVDGLTFLSPIATPPTVRDFYAFEDHVRAGRAWRGLDMEPEWYERPVFYFTSPYAVGGQGDVPIPPGCEEFDFELEVAAILGAGGSNVTPAEGEELVVGYCVLNDWSARDIQRREMKLSLGPAKGKDTFTGLGPYLVTKDEIEEHREGNGYHLKMTCTVNGRQYSEALWSDVYWSFGEMVSYTARGSEVRPGDVIGSGTCGTGCILELSQRHSSEEYPWLAAGDEVTAAIEGLGELRNVVVPGPPLLPLRPD